jgi:hypothetical protein
VSNLSELLPAGGGGKNINFVASGTLGNGVTVVLNSDGTVSAVSATGGDPSTGTPSLYASAITTYSSTTFDSNSNKIVVFYNNNNNSSYGTAVVGTVSGTSISFGSPVVFESANTTYISSTFDSNSNKVVVSYKDVANSNYGTAIVGTVSGTSISFGSPVVFAAVNVFYVSAAFDSNSNKVVISYMDIANSSYGTAVVGTVSGTSISFGSPVVFNSASSSYIKSTFDSNLNKAVIAYRDSGNSSYTTAVVGTVSGTSISFGTDVVFNAANSTNFDVTFDSNSNKIVAAYKNSSNYGAAIIGTISGTSISFGTAVVFNAANTNYIATTFDSNSNKVVIAYGDAGNSTYGTAVVGTVSGTSISFSDEVVFEAAAVSNVSCAFDSNSNNAVVSYTDTGNSNYGTSVVLQTAATNSADFLGITDAAISDTASGSVTIKGGISTKVTGLTPNADYYVQDDGSLTSPTAPVPYNLSGAVYDNINLSVASEATDPQGLSFNDDGTKVFVVDAAGDDVNEYSLSSAYDVSTGSFVQNFSLASQDTNPQDIAFNADGTKMFVVGYTGQDVNEYTLSTGFDISTASYSQNFSVASQDTGPAGLAFNTNGTKMFISGITNDNFYEYMLSTGFDISTASFVDSFSFSSQVTDPRGIEFNADGTRLYLVDRSTDSVYQYNLTTGFDISSASYSGVSFSVASQDTNPHCAIFNNTGSKMYVSGRGTDIIYQYSLNGSVSSVLAGKALSSTSINLDYTT